MAANSKLSDESIVQNDSGEAVPARSDVWLVQAPPVRLDPTPAAFAIHDAKNMVGVLSANIQALQMALADVSLPEGAIGPLADIEEASSRLAGLLREALGGLQGREPAPATAKAQRVASIVTAAVDRMRPAARARGVRIVVSGGADTRATIEPDRFERVLLNLLENALRFSQPGDTVEVEFNNSRGRFTLAVGDRGPGVPEESREQIFESYRLREAQEVGSNFGLGLAFCRAVARSHGGDAWVFNRAQGGACFVFESE